MSLSALLEIVIALALLYLLFSQITLSLMELWAGVANRRGAFLYNSLQEALGPASTALLYNTTPIKALFRQNPLQPWAFLKRWVNQNLDQPTYIGSLVFVQAVLETAPFLRVLPCFR
jgi:hypothetical protein